MFNFNSSQWIAIILIVIALIFLVFMTVSFFRQRRLVAPFAFLTVVIATAVSLLYWNTPDGMLSLNNNNQEKQAENNEGITNTSDIEEKSGSDLSGVNNEENAGDTVQKGEASVNYDDGNNYELHGNITEYAVLAGWEWPPSKQNYMKDVMDHVLYLEGSLLKTSEFDSMSLGALTDHYEQLAETLEEASSFKPPSGAEELQIFQDKYSQAMNDMAVVMKNSASFYETFGETGIISEEQLNKVHETQEELDVSMAALQENINKTFPDNVNQTALKELPSLYADAVNREELNQEID